MAITYRGASNAAGQALGSAAASTVSITPTLPTGTTNGDRVFVIENATINGGFAGAPSGWNQVNAFTVGTGTQASGSGQRQMAIYYRDYDGTWSMPAFTLTSVANNSHWVGAVSITPTTGSVFTNPTYSSTTNTFSAASTAYSYSSPSFTSDNAGFLIVGSCFNDNVTSTAVSVTQTGATIGTVTKRCDGGTGTGNIVAGKIHTASMSAGAYNTITENLTLSAASQGESVFIQQVEYVPGNLVSILSDNFNTGSTPSGSWSAASGSPVLASGQLVMPSGSKLISSTAYTFISTAFCSQVFTISTNASFGVTDGTNFLGFTFGASSVVTATNGATRTHNSGDWYQLYESGGTISPYYSSDGIVWTYMGGTQISTGAFNRHNAFPQFQNSAAPNSIFDNFNITVVDYVSKLTDNFVGTSPGSNWIVGGTAPTESGGELLVQAGASMVSANYYSVTGSFMVFQAKAMGSSMKFQTADATWGWTWTSSSSVTATGSSGSSSRTHTSGDWYRIRESGGILYWEYATLGYNWVTLDSNAVSSMGINTAAQKPAFLNSGSTTCHFSSFDLPFGGSLSLFYDDFNVPVIDRSKWFYTSGPYATFMNYSAGQGTMATIGSVSSVNSYDLTASAIYFKPYPSTGHGTTTVFSVGNYVISWTQSFFGGPVTVSGSGGGNRTDTGDWYRIRESGGTVYFDYALDATKIWTNFDSISVSGSITQLYVTYSSGGDDFADLDNVNINFFLNAGAFFAVL